METRGAITQILGRDGQDINLLLKLKDINLNGIQDLVGVDLSVKMTQYRPKRSLDANALMWKLIGDIASALRADKWDIYLKMLKRYGKYTYICVKPNVVDAVKAQWRECEVIGEIDIHGAKAVQMLCYFGSSTYDSKEFSVLLDGIISEMEEMGLETPVSQDLERALELWQRNYGVSLPTT